MPALDVSFVVEGRPVPKGNMSGFPIARGKCKTCLAKKACQSRSCFGGVVVGVSVTDQGGGELKAWDELVYVRAMSARNTAGHRIVARPGAVQVDLAFVLTRPDGHWTDSGALTSTGRALPHPTTKPDWDKVSRGVCDGLSRALVEDDSQIIVGKVALRFADWRGWTGVVVHARQICDYESWVDELLTSQGVWRPLTQTRLL